MNFDNVQPDANRCQCHHAKHEGRCMACAGTPQACLCVEFHIEPRVFACWRVIVREFMRRAREANV